MNIVMLPSVAGGIGHISRTAALAHALKRLENALGRPILRADHRHLTLTRDGEVLLEYARTLLRLNDEVRAHFSGPEVEGPVALGVPDLYAAYLLPEILGSFSRAYPRVAIELRCTRSVHLHAALEHGEVDVAIVTRQPEFGGGEVVRREPLVWVSGPVERPEAEDIVPLAVLPPGSIYRQRGLQALGEAQRKWRITSVCDSIAGLQAAVFAGLAVSILPRCAVTPGMRRLGPQEGLPALPALDLVLHRRPSGVTEAAERLAEYVAAKLRDVVPFRPARLSGEYAKGDPRRAAEM